MACDKSIVVTGSMPDVMICQDPDCSARNTVDLWMCGGYFGGYNGLCGWQLNLSKEVLSGHFNIAQVDNLQVKLMQMTDLTIKYDKKTMKVV